MTPIPNQPTYPGDYLERVYAGVLGKIIGVYLGRPFEGWSHTRIVTELGEVNDYVHQRFNVPLVVADDDISGMFTFLRALEDRGYDPDLTPAQIGDSWLNYLIEGRTILWWGGVGTSTEHTAYARLKAGIAAPESGSIARNGRTIAQQIGAQIFIDGWAMLFPGEPDRAADFARRAASVSHDGEAIYGAQVIAAIEAQAFVEPIFDHLLDTAIALIPADSIIARVIHDLRAWHASDADWYRTRALIEERYNYDRYPGACHMVPNHAVIIHALLHGNNDFQRTVMIASTDGWDTDCNAGNVGAIMGIRGGLAGIDASPVDWRGPVADWMYLASAEGGRVVTDAVRESVRIANASFQIHGQQAISPKGGARFHFSLPGSVQGFRAEDPAAVAVANHGGQLALTLMTSGRGTVTTDTFPPDDAIGLGNYTLMASPTLHPGQVVTASLAGDPLNAGPVEIGLCIHIYGNEDRREQVDGPSATLASSVAEVMTWTIPDVGGAPIAAIGFTVKGSAGSRVLVNRADWSGAPSVTLGRPTFPNTMWRTAWIDGVDQWANSGRDPFRLSQNEGSGLISQGTDDWIDYRATVFVTIPLAAEAGVAVRVGGMRRYYALLLGADGMARLVRECDGRTVLAEAPFAVDPERRYNLALEVTGKRLTASIDGEAVLGAEIGHGNLQGGGIGLVVREGTLSAGPIHVERLG